MDEENKKEYLARRDPETGKTQTLMEHSQDVAGSMRRFLEGFHLGLVGYCTGFLHDAGKMKEKFQQKLFDDAIIVHHAAAGAKYCYDRYKKEKDELWLWMAFAICGHHTGLQDYGSASNRRSCLERRMLEEEGANYSEWAAKCPELKQISLRNLPRQKFSDREEVVLWAFHAIRFLFSALVDADRLDAEQAFDTEKKQLRKEQASLKERYELFQKHMKKLTKETDQEKPINQLRAKIQWDCIQAAKLPPGFFTLYVPTGGGKTLGSMAFALEHLWENQKIGMKRIIYGIPFTSIIEQNAEVFAEIFGRENVLEHHSNCNDPFEKEETGSDAEKEKQRLKLRLAQENWDFPLICTTNVQLFESLFSCKAGKCRRLHNIADSVIILDEVQTLPLAYVRPCMMILAELVKRYHCTVVLCSATQPDYQALGVLPEDVAVRDIVTDYRALAQSMKRVSPEYLGKKSLDEIADEIAVQKQALCIVSTKKFAAGLYHQVCCKASDQEHVFHLSKNMTPFDIQKQIQKIKKRLDKKAPCLVISTQLIEAGVDIDFPCVFRAVAGIDSLIQAAGRCNREDSGTPGRFCVFEPEEANKGRGYLKSMGDIGIGVIKNMPDDFLSLEAVEAYYRKLFDINDDETDKYRILKTIYNQRNMRFPFETISDNFKLIEQSGYPVVIRNAYSEKLLEEAEHAQSLKNIARQLGMHSVNVPGYLFEEMIRKGYVTLEAHAFYVLRLESMYDENTGLNVNNDYMDVKIV